MFPGMTSKEKAVARARDEAMRRGAPLGWAVRQAGRIYGRRMSHMTYYRILGRLQERLASAA